MNKAGRRLVEFRQFRLYSRLECIIMRGHETLMTYDEMIGILKFNALQRVCSSRKELRTGESFFLNQRAHPQWQCIPLWFGGDPRRAIFSVITYIHYCNVRPTSVVDSCLTSPLWYPSPTLICLSYYSAKDCHMTSKYDRISCRNICKKKKGGHRWCILSLFRITLKLTCNVPLVM